MNHTGELYVKVGRKYISTGKTCADWNKMEAKLQLVQVEPLPPISSEVKFKWNGEKRKRIGIVTTYANCVDNHFEVECDHGERFVISTSMIIKE